MNDKIIERHFESWFNVNYTSDGQPIENLNQKYSGRWLNMNEAIENGIELFIFSNSKGEHKKLTLKEVLYNLKKSNNIRDAFRSTHYVNTDMRFFKYEKDFTEKDHININKKIKEATKITETELF